jgi:hypothetical protein
MNPGNYSITLTVTDNDTLTDSITQTVTITKGTSTLSIQVEPVKVEIGKSVIINGTLLIEGQPPKSAQSIGINYTQGQANWNILANVTTNNSGAYMYNWTPTTIGLYWLIASWNGNANTYPAYSSEITLNVTKKLSTLTIKATPTTVIVGEGITLTGKLTPSLQSENITIIYSLYFNGSLTWHLLATVQTDADGDYSYEWTTTTIGNFYVASASWPGDDLIYGSNSTTGFITINGFSSNITINVDKETVTVGSNITISGKLTPTLSNQTIKILINQVNGSGFWVYTNQTNLNGNYVYVWNTPQTGSFNITAIWQGNNITKAAESTELSVTVELQPLSFAIPDYAVGITILIIIIAAIVLKLRKKRKP